MHYGVLPQFVAPGMLHAGLRSAKTAFNEYRKAYTNYLIDVTATGSDISQTATWTVIRRYSKFHDLHTSLLKRLPQAVLPQIPPKRLTGVMDPNFVEQRKQV